MNPRDKPKGRFAKPGDFDDDDSLDRKETKFSSKKLDVPAWKKKEYVNVEKKTEERVSERKRKEVTPSSKSQTNLVTQCYLVFLCKKHDEILCAESFNRLKVPAISQGFIFFSITCNNVKICPHNL